MNLKFIAVVLICLIIGSCSTISDSDRMELSSLAREINSLFLQARDDIDRLKKLSKTLLQENETLDGLFDDNRYQYTKSHVYYTPVDDGNCEVWASGHIPIGAAEKRKIKRLEYLTADLKSIYSQSAFVDNIYFTTYDSIVMAYPYADMHAYLKPGLDLTKVWVTYWAAAEKANPGRKTLWVRPYIDAIGRGYMTSVITPVYVNDFLEGTLGIDITVDLISDKFISLSPKNMMIVTSRTIPVAINKNCYQILKIKGLEKYNYLKKEPENKSISTRLMMSRSRSKDIRTIAQWILSPQKESTLAVFGRAYIFVKEKIPEVDWFLVQIKEK